MALGPAKVRSQRDILEHRHLSVHFHVLKRTGDTDSGNLPCTPSICAVSEQRHRSADRRQRSGDQVEKRALSGSVGTDQSDDLAGANLEAHVIDCNQTAERSTNSVNLKDRLTNSRLVPVIKFTLGSIRDTALWFDLSPSEPD